MHRPEEFFARIGRDQLIGFGEGYMTGAWDAEDLGGFLTVLAAEIAAGARSDCSGCARCGQAAAAHQKSSTKNTRDNIAHHYDLSNDLFRLSSTRR